ncbi:alpha/beta hydrolase [Nitratireductor aquimarinus]|uniref:Alpha/beta hydrolase n=1 Tax=Nitratireductor aquimarinus TaxID=889300 RepID=A0ABU4AJ12_9HYPH|nr:MULTISPECIES: alpha/beta hydrolase [Nitratireductor]MBN7763436.1 alpha/beta hydrolase [Nitratireductor aquibiodomus]MCV0348600.1 alpha/beta hydrolase [Nitratireductor sp.]MDJ1462309.1 alpha/beta hydrolase [Nitratireductor sp. GZWM139]MDV6226230.1 alpha/beta hydrolase [Nitratireductor aquimarinus]
MRAFGHFGASAFLLILFSFAAQAVELHEGITYRSGLKLDIHAPDTPGRTSQAGVVRMNLFSFGSPKVPVVIYAHGGGWVKGSRKKVYSLPEWLTQRGYMLVAIDYRKVPQTTIDGQVNDLSAAISWVRSNISRYGGDPSRIVLMGHSAGAHLVAMAAARNVAGDVRGVIPNDVQAYDMVAYAGMRGSLGYPYINAFGSDPNDWVRWSPVTYARRGSGFPPHLFLHSGSNGERRRALTNGYANLLKARGARAAVFDGGRYTHGSIARKLGGQGDPATVTIERFLAQVTR